MHTIIHGDCLEELKKLDDNSVDAVITDPPYGLSNTKPAQVSDVLAAWVTGDTVSVPAKRGGFMGKDWDSFVPPPAVWAECMRVLKPGGHMAVFAGARTQDLMGLSIRLAGFEIRDTLGWVYGSGFPKSMDISKAIDKAAGAEREVIGRRVRLGDKKSYGNNGANAFGGYADNSEGDPATAPATSEAQQWSGWGTALKPAIEPIILARKSLDGTVANNVLAHGVGGLNIDACRVGMSDADREAAKVPQPVQHNDGRAVYQMGTGEGRNGATFEPAPAGRFPANVLLDEHAAKEMDEQSGVLKTGAWNGKRSTPKTDAVYGYREGGNESGRPADSGGASRFFPVFKSEEETPETKGRFPANVLLDEHAAKEMDKQSGVRQAGGYPASKGVKSSPGANGTMGGGWTGEYREHRETTQPGGASRFFPVFKYQAKAPKKERPVIEREDGSKIQHATVKPLALMEWLVSLIVPPGGVVLDPFAGSGTTLQAAINKGFQPIGIEQDADYIQLIHQRMEGGEQSTPSS